LNIKRVAVIGLDCAEPSLVFDRWRDRLPNLSALMDRGTYGPLTSCLPPITVPAWSCMASSKDPGMLGIYGFRNRKDHSYDGLSIATSLAVREPRLWDILSQRGRDNIIVGVPGTYPIARPPRGCMISGFLTPDSKADYTHPPALKRELESWVGEYMFDVKGFRTDDKTWLLEQIYRMTDRRFEVVRNLLRSRPWDLFWMVEMGHDRIHHGFWQFMDRAHHRYTPDNPFEHAIRDYYVHTAGLIGGLLELMDLNETAIWVVSDHGAKCMIGGFCLNQWLIDRGDLVLKTPFHSVTKFSFDQVDWRRTRAWGEGGYYGRLFINVAGREPQGVVPADEYPAYREQLRRALEALPDHEGRPMGTRAYKPEDIYRQVNGVAPDLIVIFGDLQWRSVGSIGHDSVYTFENDTGPDDANHAQQGLYICAHPDLPARGGPVAGPTLYDVAPTILTQLGESVPADMIGKSLI
jgi:predicted AlkP superfamily phosphohydrolase/phosphomutase